MQKSTLLEKQQSLGAEFGEYHGRQLPRRYAKTRDEYFASRTNIALMDRTYFGRLRITGSDHEDLLHRLTTNELRELQPGEGQVSIFANEKGRIIERVTLQKFDGEIRFVTSPENSEKVVAWIDKYTFIEDVRVEDLTVRLGTLSLFGPKGPEFLQTLFGEDFGKLREHHFRQPEWNGQKLQVSRTDELGFPGFDLIVETGSLSQLWDYVIDKGPQFDLQPMGEEAYEILRIEAGWPRYGKDYDEHVNPHEAGMLNYLDFDKGCYIGQEVIARLDTYEKVQKYLTGIILEGDSLPNPNDAVFIEELEVGHLTSVTHSLGFDKNIALAYIRTKFIEEGRVVIVNSNGKSTTGKLVKLPFETDIRG